MTTPPRRTARVGGRFDGIICIGGEDWWYHNRGHFDFQILRRLARDWPVLYVNSIGVRFPSPSLGGRFLAKVRRKLSSFSRGLVRVENNFWVLSPVTLPGAANSGLLGRALALQIRAQALRAGIRKPLVWVHCPAGAGFVQALSASAVILQRTDRFEAFPEGDPVVLGRAIATLKRQADLVVYCNEDLMEEERAEVSRQVMVSHGVDYERFAAAGNGRTGEPADMVALPRPRVGFIGGIDAHTFDPALMLSVAERLPWVHFVLVGASSLPQDWCALPNVSLLGRKPYDEIAGYMAANDVLIMPWNASEWIKAASPIKLKEYLAVGRPVVTTDFPALGEWRPFVRVANGPAAFAAAIETALSSAQDPEIARRAVAGETWDAKAELVRRAVHDDLGLRFAPASAPVALPAPANA